MRKTPASLAVGFERVICRERVRASLAATALGFERVVRRAPSCVHGCADARVRTCAGVVRPCRMCRCRSPSGSFVHLLRSGSCGLRVHRGSGSDVHGGNSSVPFSHGRERSGSYVQNCRRLVTLRAPVWRTTARQEREALGTAWHGPSRMKSLERSHGSAVLSTKGSLAGGRDSHIATGRWHKRGRGCQRNLLACRGRPMIAGCAESQSRSSGPEAQCRLRGSADHAGCPLNSLRCLDDTRKG